MGADSGVATLPSRRLYGTLCPFQDRFRAA
jgi:hypothetical protein